MFQCGSAEFCIYTVLYVLIPHVFVTIHSFRGSATNVNFSPHTWRPREFQQLAPEWLPLAGEWTWQVERLSGLIVTHHKLGTRRKYRGFFFFACSQTYANPCITPNISRILRNYFSLLFKQQITFVKHWNGFWVTAYHSVSHCVSLILYYGIS